MMALLAVAVDHAHGAHTMLQAMSEMLESNTTQLHVCQAGAEWLLRDLDALNGHKCRIYM